MTNVERSMPMYRACYSVCPVSLAAVTVGRRSPIVAAKSRPASGAARCVTLGSFRVTRTTAVTRTSAIGSAWPQSSLARTSPDERRATRDRRYRGCPFLARSLELEQGDLLVKPASIAHEVATRSDHAMAGQDDRDSVSVHHRSDRASCPRSPDAGGQGSVGRRLPVGHPRELPQHRDGERRERAEIQR